jgi:hypothetical protein
MATKEKLPHPPILWLLKRVFDPGKDLRVDVTDGLVVCAASSRQARDIASEHRGEEGSEVWLDYKQSTCEIIGMGQSGSKAGLILQDYHHG